VTDGTGNTHNGRLINIKPKPPRGNRHVLHVILKRAINIEQKQ